MNLLIVDEKEYANAYGESLGRCFPELSIWLSYGGTGLDGLIAEADIILAYAHDLNDDLIGRAARLKWIQAQTTGVDGIINLPSLGAEVILTNTRGIHTAAVSETALIHMLALARDFPRNIHNQADAVWERWRAGLLDGKTLGILGVGVIAEDLATKCTALGMTVVGITSTIRDLPGFDRMVDREALPQILGDLDYLVVLIPYSAATHNLIDAEFLARMKPTAFLVNVGRGEVVDDDALIAALNGGLIAGAGLDVFVEQPLPPDHPFWKMEKVIVTPHNGGRYEGIIERKLAIFETNMRAFLAGDRSAMINLVER